MQRLITVIFILALTGSLMLSPAFAGDQSNKDKDWDKSQSQIGDEKNLKGEQMRSGRNVQGRNYFSQKAIRGSDLIGKAVVNRDDEEIGTVEDIVIGQDGRVNYLVIAYGGLLGMGDSLSPIPLSKVDRTHTNENNLKISVSKAELKEAPNFADNAWPDFTDENYDEAVQGYFGGTPEVPESDAGQSRGMQKEDTRMYDEKSKTESDTN